MMMMMAMNCKGLGPHRPAVNQEDSLALSTVPARVIPESQYWQTTFFHSRHVAVTAAGTDRSPTLLGYLVPVAEVCVLLSFSSLALQISLYSFKFLFLYSINHNL